MGVKFLLLLLFVIWLLTAYNHIICIQSTLRVEWLLPDYSVSLVSRDKYEHMIFNANDDGGGGGGVAILLITLFDSNVNACTQTINLSHKTHKHSHVMPSALHSILEIQFFPFFAF